VPSRIKDQGKCKDIKGVLTWMLTTGQKDAQALSYAQLPKEVISKEQQAIAKIQ
jgi:ABC-type phosphate transport system substrate-binding protein